MCGTIADNTYMDTHGYQITITLADGSEHTFSATRKPRHWKSWAMQQCPYGTDFYGCRFAMVAAS